MIKLARYPRGNSNYRDLGVKWNGGERLCPKAQLGKGNYCVRQFKGLSQGGRWREQERSQVVLLSMALMDEVSLKSFWTATAKKSHTEKIRIGEGSKRIDIPGDLCKHVRTEEKEEAARMEELFSAVIGSQLPPHQNPTRISQQTLCTLMAANDLNL